MTHIPQESLGFLMALVYELDIPVLLLNRLFRQLDLSSGPSGIREQLAGHSALTEFLTSQDKQPSKIKITRTTEREYSRLGRKLAGEAILIVPFGSSMYPQQLENNIALPEAPPLLYLKGNPRIFREKRFTISGNEHPDTIQLTRIANICQEHSRAYNVLLSGDRPGSEGAAVSSTLEAGGQVIQILSQGLLGLPATRHVNEQAMLDGNVLLVSTAHPSQPLSTSDPGLPFRLFPALANPVYWFWPLPEQYTIPRRLPSNNQIYLVEGARADASEQKTSPERLYQKGVIPYERSSVFRQLYMNEH